VLIEGDGVGQIAAAALVMAPLCVAIDAPQRIVVAVAVRVVRERQEDEK
jgi:hypothetical protein